MTDWKRVLPTSTDLPMSALTLDAYPMSGLTSAASLTMDQLDFQVNIWKGGVQPTIDSLLLVGDDWTIAEDASITTTLAVDGNFEDYDEHGLTGATSNTFVAALARAAVSAKVAAMDVAGDKVLMWLSLNGAQDWDQDFWTGTTWLQADFDASIAEMKANMRFWLDAFPKLRILHVGYNRWTAQTTSSWVTTNGFSGTPSDVPGNGITQRDYWLQNQGWSDRYAYVDPWVGPPTAGTWNAGLTQFSDTDDWDERVQHVLDFHVYPILIS